VLEILLRYRRSNERSVMIPLTVALNHTSAIQKQDGGWGLPDCQPGYVRPAAYRLAACFGAPNLRSLIVATSRRATIRSNCTDRNYREQGPSSIDRPREPHNLGGSTSRHVTVEVEATVGSTTTAAFLGLHHYSFPRRPDLEW
jgi:hypothetical protein